MDPISAYVQVSPTPAAVRVESAATQASEKPAHRRKWGPFQVTAAPPQKADLMKPRLSRCGRSDIELRPPRAFFVSVLTTAARTRSIDRINQPGTILYENLEGAVLVWAFIFGRTRKSEPQPLLR